MSQHGPQTPTYQGLLIMCHNSLECITSFILSMCIIYSPEPLSWGAVLKIRDIMNNN